MRRIVAVTLLAGLTAANAWAGLFDQLKQKANQAVNEAVDEAVDSAKPKQTPQQQNKSQIPNQQNTAAKGQPINTVDDLYGQWEGLVRPSNQSHSIMSGMTVYITITPDFAGMRVSAAASRCLAELTPTDTLGRYRADFIDENQSCGSKAIVTFASGGNVTINWTDMPNTDAEGRTYIGQLTKKTPPYPRNWSTPADRRDRFDIVGLHLGMTYEEALDYLDKHPDFEKTVSFVKDLGSTSIVIKLVANNAKKIGPEVFGEQMTLLFESQTPDEMNVEQDPEVLAAIEKRKKIIEQRDEMIQQQNAQRRTRRGEDAPSQLQLPEIPDMPKLRPAGAEAQLVVISRQIQYGNRQGPHPDKVINALSKKYGTPSVKIERQAGVANTYLLGWIFDASGNFNSDAAGSSCDLLTPTGYDLKKLAHYYSTAATASHAAGMFNQVMISPHCGLTLACEIRTETDGSVWRIATTAYDQQRLLGDEWYRTSRLSRAMIAQQKAKSKALESRDVPEF
jgi:hypothetical protein